MMSPYTFDDADYEQLEAEAAWLLESTRNTLRTAGNAARQAQKTADLLKTAVYSPPPPPPARFPGDPGPGLLYYGESREGGDPTDRETYCGHPVGLYRSYFDTGDTAATLGARVARDLGKGRLPVVSTKLPDTWANVAAGKQDGWLTDRIGAMDASGGPFGFCLHHEPEDDQGTGQQPGDWLNMHRHLMTLKTPRMFVVPIIQFGPFDPGFEGYKGLSLADWFAPDSCDVVGFDSYNHWHTGKNMYHWRDVPDFTADWNLLSQFGKPLLLAEYGVRTDPADPGKAAQWMADLKAACITAGVVGISFYDETQNTNDGGTPWDLSYSGDGTDGTERLGAFKTSLTATGSFFLS